MLVLVEALVVAAACVQFPRPGVISSTRAMIALLKDPCAAEAPRGSQKLGNYWRGWRRYRHYSQRLVERLRREGKGLVAMWKGL